MGYNSTTKLITAPVSIKDLQQCFGLSDTDLGTLITKANINKWSKYKSVSYAKISTLTDAEFVSVRYGLSIPLHLSLYDLGEAVIGGTSVWGYSKSSGGQSSPYRITDFNGYEHSAAAWHLNNKWNLIFGGTIQLAVNCYDNMELKNNDVVRFYMSTREDGGDYGNLLSIEDFWDAILSSYDNLKNWYGGIAFRDENDTTSAGYRYFIDTSTILNNGIDIDTIIGASGSPLIMGHHYQVIPFLTSGGTVTKGVWGSGSFKAGFVSFNGANFRVYRRFMTPQDEYLEGLSFKVTSFVKGSSNINITIQASNTSGSAYNIARVEGYYEIYLLLVSEQSYDSFGNDWETGWVDNTSKPYSTKTYAEQIRHNECYTTSGETIRWGRSVRMGMSSIAVGTTNLGTFTINGLGDSFGNFTQYDYYICIQFQNAVGGRIVMV